MNVRCIVARLLEDDPDEVDPKKEFMRLPGPPEFKIDNDGSLFLVWPLTEKAYKWLHDTAPEDAQFMAGGMAVEHRYIDDVVAAIREAGFAVS